MEKPETADKDDKGDKYDKSMQDQISGLTYLHTHTFICIYIYIESPWLLFIQSVGIFAQVTYGRGLLKIFNTGKNFGFISPVFKGEDHEGPPLPSSVDEGLALVERVEALIRNESYRNSL